MTHSNLKVGNNLKMLQISCIYFKYLLFNQNNTPVDPLQNRLQFN
jgi:hypothetical protein